MVTNKVKEYREELGITQVELSERAGVSRTMLSKLETNQKVDCKVSTILAIAKALGKPVNEIFLS